MLLRICRLVHWSFDRISKILGCGKFSWFGRPSIRLYIISCRKPGYGKFPGYQKFPGYRNFPGYGSLTSNTVYHKTIGIRK